MSRSRRRQQGVTIRDVARKAGVSPMTVSRVINNGDNVTDATRAAVTAAIQELEYAPNPAARRLAGWSAFRIGLLYSNPSAAFLSEFLLGALDESAKTGHQLAVEKCTMDAERDRQAIRKLAQSGVTALILPPPLCEVPGLIEEIKGARMAAILVAPGESSEDFASVRIDNECAAREMTEHLLAQGHRCIGYIKGNPNQSVSELRFRGFQQALRNAGLDPDRMPVETGRFDYQSGLEASERLLASEPRPTAIFAANDDMAAAASAVAHRQGLDVPVDLSVAGFDDTMIASTVWPALTTVRQPIADMGRLAVGLLLDEIERCRDGRKRGPVQKVMEHTLVQRGSTGRAPEF